MDNLNSYIENIIEKSPVKIIISNPVSKTYEFNKIVLEKRNLFYQEERNTKKQVFHSKIRNEELHEYLINHLTDNFIQLNAFDATNEYSIRISKKKKILFTKSSQKISCEITSEHNRKKNYIFEEGQLIEPLIDMGIFTKEGKVLNSMQGKFRQINRFIEMIDDVIKDYNKDEITVIDFGCGKSYLTFILYYYLQSIKNISVKMIGLDLKEDVINDCNLVAKKYNYDNLFFQIGDIGSFKVDFPVDMVITLHACDTATDLALFNAIVWNAKYIFSVPCCQHEFNKQITSDEFSIIGRYGIVKERIAALMTDAVRGNLLTYCGYKTQLLEFVDFEHTPKNILIRAIKSNITKKKKDEMLAEVERLITEFNITPSLLQLLKNEGVIS